LPGYGSRSNLSLPSLPALIAIAGYFLLLTFRLRPKPTVYLVSLAAAAWNCDNICQEKYLHLTQSWAPRQLAFLAGARPGRKGAERGLNARGAGGVSLMPATQSQFSTFCEIVSASKFSLLLTCLLLLARFFRESFARNKKSFPLFKQIFGADMRGNSFKVSEPGILLTKRQSRGSGQKNRFRFPQEETPSPANWH